jgi:hypothetical protein
MGFFVKTSFEIWHLSVVLESFELDIAYFMWVEEFKDTFSLLNKMDAKPESVLWRRVPTQPVAFQILKKVLSLGSEIHSFIEKCVSLNPHLSQSRFFLKLLLP